MARAIDPRSRYLGNDIFVALNGSTSSDERSFEQAIWSGSNDLDSVNPLPMRSSSSLSTDSSRTLVDSTSDDNSGLFEKNRMPVYRAEPAQNMEDGSALKKLPSTNKSAIEASRAIQTASAIPDIEFVQVAIFSTERRLKVQDANEDEDDWMPHFTFAYTVVSDDEMPLMVYLHDDDISNLVDAEHGTAMTLFKSEGDPENKKRDYTFRIVISSGIEESENTFNVVNLLSHLQGSKDVAAAQRARIDKNKCDAFFPACMSTEKPPGGRNNPVKTFGWDRERDAASLVTRLSNIVDRQPVAYLKVLMNNETLKELEEIRKLPLHSVKENYTAMIPLSLCPNTAFWQVYKLYFRKIGVCGGGIALGNNMLFSDDLAEFRGSGDVLGALHAIGGRLGTISWCWSSDHLRRFSCRVRSQDSHLEWDVYNWYNELTLLHNACGDLDGAVKIEDVMASLQGASTLATLPDVEYNDDFKAHLRDLFEELDQINNDPLKRQDQDYAKIQRLMAVREANSWSELGKTIISTINAHTNHMHRKPTITEGNDPPWSSEITKRFACLSISEKITMYMSLVQGVLMEPSLVLAPVQCFAMGLQSLARGIGWCLKKMMPQRSLSFIKTASAFNTKIVGVGLTMNCMLEKLCKGVILVFGDSSSFRAIVPFSFFMSCFCVWAAVDKFLYAKKHGRTVDKWFAGAELLIAAASLVTMAVQLGATWCLGKAAVPVVAFCGTAGMVLMGVGLVVAVAELVVGLVLKEDPMRELIDKYGWKYKLLK
ncbi:hypothetical protein CPB83DRAFT_837118 [Crepidotus variabilis]|uniref:Uncharacterized protein n=1 Tax=Crepidotus variabilis TaxID=179855 RepID=A0A9P6JNH6_9AGAR|nr:hypothetical protein CPB83DRAFT_837118 [Crepidotus variabilis]